MVRPSSPRPSGEPGRRGSRIAVGVAVLALVAVAGTLGGRLVVEARLRRVVEGQLAARLPGRTSIGAVRVEGPTRAVVEDFRWAPAEGPIARVEIARLRVRASPLGWLRGERRLRGIELEGGRVVLAPRSSGEDAGATPADPDARLEERLVAKLRAAVERAQRTVPASVGKARGALDAVLLPGSSAELRDIDVDGLPSGLSLSQLSASVAAGTGRGLAIDASANLSFGGQFQLSAMLEPLQAPRVHLALEDLALVDLLGGDGEIVEGLSVESGTLAGALDVEPAPVGEGPLIGLQVRLQDASLHAEGFDGYPWQVDASQDLLVQPSSKRIEFRKWGWTVGRVKGSVDAEIESLDTDPKVELALVLDGVDMGDVATALPRGTLPDEWGLKVTGPLSLRAWLEGPLSDRQYWKFDWKADWSKIQIVADPKKDPVAKVAGPFDFAFQRTYHEPFLRRMGVGDPHWTSYDEASHAARMAVVAAEDAGFFGHQGFDAEGIQQAVLENLREGGEGRGGSTITQQLAKNLFLSQDRTVIRKLREALLAYRMEDGLSKARILELYFNVAEWGHGMYGMKDAAWHWFGKPPSELRPREAALLALLLPSPRRYHDYYHPAGKVTEHLQESIDGMVRRMWRLKFIDDDTYVLEMTWGLHFAGCAGGPEYDEPQPKGPPPEPDQSLLSPEGEPLTFWDLDPGEEPGLPPEGMGVPLPAPPVPPPHAEPGGPAPPVQSPREPPRGAGPTGAGR